MTIDIPVDVLCILHTLQKNDFQAYIVGGAVRDLLAGKTITDWDFTTNAKPEEILNLFDEAFYENEFGTVAVTRNDIREQFNLPLLTQKQEKKENEVINVSKATKIHESLQPSKESLHKEEKEQKHIFEITTFRSEGVYTDFRRPQEVQWGTSIHEDLDRRDFTINAMAIEIDTGNSNIKNQDIKDSKTQSVSINTHTLIDPHNGQEDLYNNIIRTVGNPNKRFQEDALRMLRAIRFSVQLNFIIHTETLTAITQHAPLIKHISWERIRDEFLKILSSSKPKQGILELDKTGLLYYILPELEKTKGVKQGGHHTTDVWTHSLDALNSCPSNDPIVRLATLLHDIAKPQTYAVRQGNITFYNHHIVGSRIASKIAKRLKLSKKNQQRIFTLVRYHMFHYQPKDTDAAIRRFMRKVGLHNVNDILDLRIGDRLGSGSRRTSWRLEEMKQRMQEQLNQPFDREDLAIDGNDLMQVLAIKPGKILGILLDKLTEEVIDNPSLNTKEQLLDKAQELLFVEQQKSKHTV